ncbi:FecR domain-containing protein [Seonamhaeicola sp.]|uniref:FecR family protein n=1 Tax=Seonamhaeicola sp. TaxID=1912245 RepID=UPI002607EDB2|nr:FecR domain-containing protein [Seonamhaeicola sp.]
MDRIKRILKLSKGIALRILKDETINTTYIENEFSNTDTKDIVDNLTSEGFKKERDQQIKHINKNKHQDWIKIKPTDNTENKGLFIFFFRAAAVLIICAGLGYYYFENNSDLNSSSKEPNNITQESTDANSIILELDNGEKEIITTNGTKTILNKEGKVVGTQKGTNLNYTNPSVEKLPEELIYNKLTIPYGKVFQITLSDGTKVHLNAGSSIRYPVYFIKDKNRIVYLEGEAYFDVVKNSEQPFIVKTDNMNIEVLGTKFNVSSYPEDPSINTVLVEGSVSINSDKNKNNTILKPGHKADWKKQSGKVLVNNVDTSIYTAWIEGRIVFEHMPFENILVKLERHYDISITNNNLDLAKETFTASFDIESIEQVLKAFSKNYHFTYTINQDQITID